MSTYDYNIGTVSKYTIENFWNKLDKNLPVSQVCEMYKRFYEQNTKMINESVNAMLIEENINPHEYTSINEGFADKLRSNVADDDSELEDGIPDDNTPVKKKQKQKPGGKTTPQISGSLNDDATDWMSQLNPNVMNVKGDPYKSQDTNDINFMCDLIYHKLKKGQFGDLTTQDKILPYSILNTTSVTNFTAVFAFKDLPNVDLSNWNVEYGLKFEGMFYKSTFNNDSIRGWKLSKAENVRNMFTGSDFDKQDVINGWKATINPALGYLPVIGQTSADSTEVVGKKIEKKFGIDSREGIRKDLERKFSTLKQNKMESEGIMNADEKKSYVMNSTEFINEKYGINEGAIGDFAKKAYGKFKDAMSSVGIKLKNGFLFVLDKVQSMIGANLPQNIANFINNGNVKGAYMSVGKPLTDYPAKSGYYEDYDENTPMFKNYEKFWEYITTMKPAFESYNFDEDTQAVNERRVGLRAKEKVDGITYQNIGAPDINSTMFKEMIRDRIDEIKTQGTSKLEPMIVWGAPGIGKTTIPGDILKEFNKEVASAGGTNADKMSIIVVDCSMLQAGDLTMPMPVSIDNKEAIAAVQSNETVMRIANALGMKEEELASFATAKSSDAPKTWLPMWKPTGNADIDRGRNAQANGWVNVVEDEDGVIVSSETHCNGGILVFDEFLRADPDTLFGIAQIMMERRMMGGYRLGSKWAVIGCSNRPTDDCQVEENWAKSSDAFKQRSGVVNFVPDFSDWCRWAKEKGGFDDFTIDWIGQYGADTAKSRWHNVDPQENENSNEGRSVTPRNWSRAIKELNRLCKIKGVDSYMKLGERFLTVLKMFLPDKIAENYHEDYIDNGGSSKFNYGYETIINDPTLKVTDKTPCSTITNHLKNSIKRKFSIKNPIPAEDFAKLMDFLELNFGQKGGGTTSEFLVHVCKWCDLVGTNQSDKYIDIIDKYEKLHPSIDLETLFNTVQAK